MTRLRSFRLQMREEKVMQIFNHDCWLMYFTHIVSAKIHNLWLALATNYDIAFMCNMSESRVIILDNKLDIWTGVFIYRNWMI